jgi:hypothetical protein
MEQRLVARHAVECLFTLDSNQNQQIESLITTNVCEFCFLYQRYEFALGILKHITEQEKKSDETKP